MNNLSIEDKLDICFGDLHQRIEDDLGYKVFKAIEDIVEICDIKRVTKCGATQYSFYYDNCANYEYRNYSLDELKNSYEIVLNEQDKNNIKDFVQDIKNDYINLSIDEIICNTFTRDKYEDDQLYSEVESYIAMLIADKYYRYFWKENLENYLNEILEYKEEQ